MAKISPVSAKYIIHTNIQIEGVVDKPDVIGAIFGRNTPNEKVDKIYPIAKAFHDKFRETFATTSCFEITKDIEWKSAAHKEHCSKVASKTAEILAETINSAI